MVGLGHRARWAWVGTEIKKKIKANGMKLLKSCVSSFEFVVASIFCHFSLRFYSTAISVSVSVSISIARAVAVPFHCCGCLDAVTC